MIDENKEAFLEAEGLDKIERFKEKTGTRPDAVLQIEEVVPYRVNSKMKEISRQLSISNRPSSLVVNTSPKDHGDSGLYREAVEEVLKKNRFQAV